MKNIFYSGFCAVGLLVLVSGCASDRPVGIIFTDASADVQVAGSDLRNLKLGMSVAKSYFGLVGVGDCSIDTAAKNGGITDVKIVDKAYYTLFGYTKITTKVYGTGTPKTDEAVKGKAKE